MSSPWSSELVVSEIYDRNPVRLAGAARLRLSWVRNGAGELSAAVPVADLAAAGLPVDLLGYWVRWEPGVEALRWAGVLARPSVAGGMVELAALSFDILFQGFVWVSTYGTGTVETIRPGQIFSRPIAGADGYAAEAAPQFRGLDVDVLTGPAVEVEARNADYYDAVLPGWVEATGWEWDVTPDRIVRARPRLGVDRTGESGVRLVEGRQVAAPRWATDLSEVWTAALATGRTTAGTPIARWAPAAAGTAAAARLWPRTRVVDVGEVGSSAEIEYRAQREADRSSRIGAAVTLDVVDVDGAWGAFAPGDTVAVELGPSGMENGRLTVAEMALDLEAGVMTVAGDAEWA